MTEKSMESDYGADLQVQETLQNAITTAVETARRQAAEHPYLGHPVRRRSDDHFAFIALFRSFLMFCGADLKTHRGGNVEKAASMLRIGEKIARGWQRENPDGAGMKITGDSGPSDQDLKERSELLRSAERLARNIIIQALVEHAGKEDSGFRERVEATLEARLTNLTPENEIDEIFAIGARGYMAHLIRKPS